MPSFNSDRGVWTPAKEKAVAYKKNADGSVEPVIYEGPDRAAQQLLKEKGVEYLGGDVTQDPDLIMRAKQMDKTVEEYLKLNDPPTKEEMTKKERVVTHKSPKRKKGVQPPQTGPMAGGFADDGQMPV